MFDTTPIDNKKFKCIFTIRDYSDQLPVFEKEGIDIRKDDHGIFACAFFETITELECFKKRLA